jgi:hypothetical protein
MQLRQQAERLASRLKKSELSSATGESAEQLRLEVDRRRRELNQQQAQLAKLGRFASLDEPHAVPRLNVALAELAKASGVRIRERSGFNRLERQGQSNQATAPIGVRDGDRAAGVTASLLGAAVVENVGVGSLQRLVIEARFGGLRDFLEGLNQLPWPVAVVDFEIKTTEARNALGQPLLSCELVMAF